MENISTLFSSFNFLSWFLLAVGMQYSAGPANILVATSVGKMGFRRSVPVLAGLWLPAIVYSLVVGLGFNTINKSYDLLFDLLTLLGTLYIFYLSYSLFKAPSDVDSNAPEQSIQFADGFILSTFNGKLLAAIIAMYAVALIERSTFLTVILITILFTINGLFAQFLWGLGGKAFSTFMGTAHVRLQNTIYAVLLALVAVWMLYLLFAKYL